jgi:hypothetical protein
VSVFPPHGGKENKMLNLKIIFDPDRIPLVVIQRAITPNQLPAAWHFLWDERAATMEYDYGLSREQAEAMALAEICKQMQAAQMK